MTDHEKLVMRNIIYAVETGGQVYGQKDYADFTEAYTNSSAEHAITIGAGQWYGNEARTLLLKIKTTDAATFSKYDTAGVAADLNKTDWSNYQLSKTSAKAKAIVHIINSTVGHRCQDQLRRKDPRRARGRDWARLHRRAQGWRWPVASTRPVRQPKGSGHICK